MPGVPYVTPAMLMAAPQGISWTVVPQLTASTAAQMAQLADVCRKGTSAVDRYVRQHLRATVVTETWTGPGQNSRVSVDRDTAIGRLIARNSFISQILAVQVSPARAFPPQYELVPAGQFSVRDPMQVPVAGTVLEGPSGGNETEVAPGWITWRHGRGGQRVTWSFICGWPHCSLTEDAAAEASVLQVDDVTGWAGFGGIAYDSTATEGVQVGSVSATAPLQLPGAAGTTQAGPGTLTLSSPLGNAHEAGTVISAMPADLTNASVLACAVQALLTLDAIATQSLSGQMAGGTAALAEEMELALDDYRRKF